MMAKNKAQGGGCMLFSRFCVLKYVLLYVYVVSTVL